MWTYGISFDGYVLVPVNGYWVARPWHPMEMALEEIEKALEHSLYYLAIVMALTLPDVCSALENPKGLTNGGMYRRWCKKHLKSRFPHMSPNSLQDLRNGVIHSGQTGIANQQYGRVIFTVPHPSGNRILNSSIDMGSSGVLQLDATDFCQGMVEAVRDWYEQVKADVNVKANLPNLVRLRPSGFPPHIVGFPVIA
jgi:hypothetical protein